MFVFFSAVHSGHASVCGWCTDSAAHSGSSASPAWAARPAAVSARAVRTSGVGVGVRSRNGALWQQPLKVVRLETLHVVSRCRSSLSAATASLGPRSLRSSALRSTAAPALLVGAGTGFARAANVGALGREHNAMLGGAIALVCSSAGPNPSVEGTHNGGARLLASAASAAPSCAPHSNVGLFVCMLRAQSRLP